MRIGRIRWVGGILGTVLLLSRLLLPIFGVPSVISNTVAWLNWIAWAWNKEFVIPLLGLGILVATFWPKIRELRHSKDNELGPIELERLIESCPGKIKTETFSYCMIRLTGTREPAVKQVWVEIVNINPWEDAGWDGGKLQLRHDNVWPHAESHGFTLGKGDQKDVIIAEYKHGASTITICHIIPKVGRKILMPSQRSVIIKIRGDGIAPLFIDARLEIKNGQIQYELSSQ